MANSKKLLMIVSLVILALAVFSLVWGVIGMVTFDVNKMEIPEGTSPEMAKIISYISYAILLVLILPRIYIGVIGLLGGTSGSRAHITVAKVFFVISIIALISTISAMFQSTNLLKATINLLEAILSTALYVFYIKFASDVAKG